MAYQLKEINEAAAKAPAEFIAKCDQAYQASIARVADAIQKNLVKSPVVLLSGPSGSGKTTTSLKLEEELERRGLRAHPIALDHYFVERHPGDVLPLTPKGEVDLESPDLLDWSLLSAHFTALERHEPIDVPHFVFTRQLRNPAKAKRVELGPNEIAIFEGIHALNPRITAAHPDALRLYISARSDIVDGAEVVFKRTWLRLARRAVRDNNFRGYDAAATLANWANVRRGEKLYISPYKDAAHIQFDTALAYEASVMANFAKPLLAEVPPDNPRARELLALIGAFERFVPIDPALVPPDSLVREFIGGSIYHY